MRMTLSLETENELTKSTFDSFNSKKERNDPDSCALFMDIYQ